MQFAKEEVMEAELNLDECVCFLSVSTLSENGHSEEIKTSFPELEPKYEDAAYNVVSTVFKAVTGKKAVSPSSNFSSADGQSAVKCNCACDFNNRFRVMLLMKNAHSTSERRTALFLGQVYAFYLQAACLGPVCRRQRSALRAVSLSFRAIASC